MKEGYWTSWIPQDKPKEQCSCEHVLPFTKTQGGSKGSSDVGRAANDTTRPGGSGPGRGTVSRLAPNSRAVILVSPEDRVLSQKQLLLKSSDSALPGFGLAWDHDPFLLPNFFFWKENVYPMPVPSYLGNRLSCCLTSQVHSWIGILPQEELYLQSHPCIHISYSVMSDSLRPHGL